MKLSLLALAGLSTALPQESPQGQDFAPFCTGQCFNQLKGVYKTTHPTAVYPRCEYLCGLKETELQACTDRCVGAATEGARTNPFTVKSWWEMKRGCDDTCAQEVAKGFIGFDQEN
ncbi:hypothetical protein L249_3961 [Ophiocordyceps polyrhachis-furcata BCC 54312]|uniref:Uncharacterized protein n=1 Tax=Ophiocordyceps polyrhachis-furcata BCC 54312 TaxID=1330021 RepID=A0A367L4Z9_9HYPO|nr:hypothetical protein L249_3961 [Ophiocordyceps polyrhachis-furcata BCC 54312]